MTTPPIVGHADVRERLLDLLRRGRLPHAILFTGPAGVGKSLVARWLGSVALCERGDACGTCRSCARVAAGTHPDFTLVELPAGKKEIGIEIVRRLKHFVGLQVVAGGRKIAIVDDADRLSVAAQNALLKTLEEPGGAALIVLVTATASSLLSTIRSRCQVVRFRPLSTAEVATVLESEEGVGSDEAATLAAASEGSPGRAMQLRRQLGKNDADALGALLADLDTSRYSSVVSLSEWLGRTEEDLTSRLELLLRAYRDMAVDTLNDLAPGGAEAIPGAADPERAVRSFDAVRRALTVVRRRNPNRPLLADALALRLART